MQSRTVKPKPVDRENEFGIQEIFFSTTDFVGNITSGNNVFVRVSQYDKSELMGAPHNIIRHPDMPRLVFKVLWDYLKAKKPVVAYVKNMTKEGLYYWVLASAFPVPNGYLSIRIKPSTEILKLMPDIYNKLLIAEEKGGMEASLKLLLEVLKSKGFDDYDSFMTTVLIAELNSRQNLINANPNAFNKSLSSDSNHYQDARQEGMVSLLKEIKTLCGGVTDSFERLFNDFNNLLSVEKKLKSTSTSILNFSGKISILSLNAILNSNFEGEAGRTLAVVANTISVNKGKIETFTRSIVNISNDISQHTQKLGFQTSTPRLQSAMINAFVQELYELSVQGKISTDDVHEMESNILVLIDLFMGTFSQLTELLNPISGKINEILELISAINKSIYELELCSFLGKIEAAKIGEKGGKFNITFGEIKECSETIKDSLLEFRMYLIGVIATTEAIQAANIKILTFVASIKEAVNRLKTIEGQPALEGAGR